MGDSGVRSYVVFRTDVFVEPAPSVHNDEWSRVVIITVFHSYLPFTVKPKSVYRFTITRKTKDQTMNYSVSFSVFDPLLNWKVGCVKQ